MSGDTAPEAHPGVQRSVLLASFENRHAAERMLASLGREFRKKARKGHVAAVVISGNKDGSLKVTQSRVLTGSGFADAVLRISLSWTVGFMGIVSIFKGAERGGHAGQSTRATSDRMSRLPTGSWLRPARTQPWPW